MPTKRKFTARFPTAKIKRIMQVDEEVGKISATVPSVVSCALETCISQLVTKAYELALSRNSRTVTPSHLKQVIEEITEFKFALELVKEVPILKPVKQSNLDNGNGTGSSSHSMGGLCGLENMISSTSDFSVIKKRGRPKKSVKPQTGLNPEPQPPKKKKRRKSGMNGDDDPLNLSTLPASSPPTAELVMDSSSSTE